MYSPQTSTNDQKLPANDYKLPANDHKISTNDHKLPVSDNKWPPLLSNQKADVLFFLPKSGSYKDSQILENIGSKLGKNASFFQSICAEQEIKVMLPFIGLEKSTFLLITFKHK